MSFVELIFKTSEEAGKKFPVESKLSLGLKTLSFFESTPLLRSISLWIISINEKDKGRLDHKLLAGIWKKIIELH